VARPACDTNRDCPSGLHCAWDGYCDGTPARTGGGPPGALDTGLSEDDALAIAVRAATKKYRTGSGTTARR
jgi:hypothetical protein